MAITFYGYTDVAGTFTANMDMGTGSNRLIVLAGLGDVSDNLSAVTVNGESMTRLYHVIDGTGSTRYQYIWYLNNPVGTGSKQYVMSGITDSSTMGFSVFNSDYLGSVSSAVDNQGSGTTAATVSLTAVDGDWLIGTIGMDQASQSAGAGTAKRSAGGHNAQVDSNGTANPTSLNTTISSSGKFDATGFVFHAPAPAASGVSLLDLLGVGT